jgi:hypothetical protein
VVCKIVLNYNSARKGKGEGVCGGITERSTSIKTCIFRLLTFFLDRYWTDKDNRRNFFDEFAATRNFDPLIPEKWNSVSYADIVGVKVCNFFGGLCAAVLMSCGERFIVVRRSVMH